MNASARVHWKWSAINASSTKRSDTIRKCDAKKVVAYQKGRWFAKARA